MKLKRNSSTELWVPLLNETLAPTASQYPIKSNCWSTELPLQIYKLNISIQKKGYRAQWNPFSIVVQLLQRENYRILHEKLGILHFASEINIVKVSIADYQTISNKELFCSIHTCLFLLFLEFVWHCFCSYSKERKLDQNIRRVSNFVLIIAYFNHKSQTRRNGGGTNRQCGTLLSLRIL